MLIKLNHYNKSIDYDMLCSLGFVHKYRLLYWDKMNRVQCVTFTIRHTMYCVHCTPYTVQCTLLFIVACACAMQGLDQTIHLTRFLC